MPICEHKGVVIRFVGFGKEKGKVLWRNEVMEKLVVFIYCKEMVDFMKMVNPA